MRTGLVVIALLAACGGQGVDLEVTSDVPFDRVELFVADDHCYDDGGTPCTEGVAWETGMLRPAGDVYVMKTDENVVATKVVSDKRAVLHLEAINELRDPKVIAVVGFKSDVAVAYATLWTPHIPVNSAETWHLKLDKAEPANDKIMVPPARDQATLRAHAWKRVHETNPDALSRCLALQTWVADQGVWKSIYIVPDSDTDCDAREIECDPLYADYNVGSPAGACVTPSETLAAHPCVIGASLCADGVSADSSCRLGDPSLYCLPDEICNVCKGKPAVAACLVNTVMTDDQVTHYTCDFVPSSANNGSCGQGKEGASAQFTLPRPCENLEVRSLSAPFSSSGSPNKAFVGMAEITATLNSSGTDCTVTLDWTDSIATPGQSATFVFLFRSLTSTNVAAVPVTINMGPATATCTNVVTEPPQCTSTTDATADAMFSCL